jgi:hypothetical protein
MHRGTPFVAVLGTLFCLLLAPRDVAASVLELFGGGPRSVSMAGAMAAAAYGAEAAFENPSLLADASYGGVFAGIAYSTFQTNVRLARPVCTEAYAVCRARHGTAFSHRAPKAPPSNTSLQLGWHAPLAGPLGKRVVVGAMMTLPLGRVLSISGPDPQTPHFYMYEGLPDRFALLLSASFEPTSWMAFGVGTQILASLSSDVDMVLDVNNHVMDHASVDVRLQPIARMVAGVMARPTAGVRLGVSYRQEVNFSYDIPSNIDIGTTAGAALVVEQQTLYSPDSWHFGAAYRSPTGRLLVTLSTSFALWSAAPDPSPRVEIDLSGKSLDAVGLGEVLDVGQESPPISLRFANTWAPSIGVEWLAFEKLMLRAGYGFVPTPSRRAVGAFNYLDNDAHVIGSGFDIGVGAPLQSRPPSGGPVNEPPRFDHDLFVRLAVQAKIHPRTSVNKVDSNDPVGDFEHDGAVLHGSLSLGGTW